MTRRMRHVLQTFVLALVGVTLSSSVADAAPPARWGCAPIGWVYSEAFATPPGFHQEIVNAVDRLERLTGLDFRYAGTTNVEPSLAAFRPSRDVQVVIGRGWTSAPDKAGSTWKLLDGDRIVGAAVAFAQGDWTGKWLDTIRHELGHLAGLGHVDDPTDLMHPTSRRAEDYSDLDRSALSSLGCPTFGLARVRPASRGVRR